MSWSDQKAGRQAGSTGKKAWLRKGMENLEHALYVRLVELLENHQLIKRVHAVGRSVFMCGNFGVCARCLWVKTGVGCVRRQQNFL